MIAPMAIWVSMMPNRKDRRANVRRRVRNNSWKTAQTPNEYLMWLK